jgi:hypothetical protein
MGDEKGRPASRVRTLVGLLAIVVFGCVVALVLWLGDLLGVPHLITLAGSVVAAYLASRVLLSWIWRRSAR